MAVSLTAESPSSSSSSYFEPKRGREGYGRYPLNEASSDNEFIQDQKLYLAIFKQVHTSTTKSISVLPSARRVALVTFYVKQELPPDLKVHQELC